MVDVDQSELSEFAEIVDAQFGASEARTLSQLLPRHYKILAQIVRQVRDLATYEADREDRIRANAKSYAADAARREPIFAFLIDGLRGSGKTSLARTVRAFLQECSDRQIGGGGHAPATQLLQTAGPVFHPDKPETDQPTAPETTDIQPVTVGQTRRAWVHALPMLKPDDMEASEFIMEAIFAQMLRQLEFWEDAEHTTPDSRAEASRLADKLRNRVAKGWHFAQQSGTDALLNDSMSFEEYIERRAEESKTSHDRIDLWRNFVMEYLDFFRAQMLGIFVDDMDLERHLARDLLQSIRVFLSHPRIFCVVAANLHATRQKLLADSLADAQQSFQALRGTDSFTAKLWREFERESLEEYLAKVFPRPFRAFVKLEQHDFGKLLAVRSHQNASGQRTPHSEHTSFVEFCTNRMHNLLWSFRALSFQTRSSKPDDPSNHRLPHRPLSDIPALQQDVEDYLSLWLLRNHYAEVLAPRSARHLNQFAQMIDPNIIHVGRPQHTERKRVAVALFTDTQNAALLQRHTDRDSNVIEWLNAQTVRSGWRGTRWIRVNELHLTPNSPSYHYLLYRIDLEMSKPAHAYQNVTFSTALLPEPAGRKVWTPEVWQRPTRKWQREQWNIGLGTQGTPHERRQLTLRQELQGLARTLSNPIIPANCAYFKDLRGLPDLAWAWNESDQAEPPDRRRCFGQFPVMHIDNLFRLRAGEPVNDYFRQIVLIYGSFPLLPPVPPNEFVADSYPLHYYELKLEHKNGDPADGYAQRASTSNRHLPSLSQTDVPSAYRPSGFWIRIGALALGRTIQKVSLGTDAPLARLARAQQGKFSQNHLRKELEQADPIGLDAEDDDSDDPFKTTEYYKYICSNIVKIAPRYMRIMNDVRCAFHALRILEQDLNDLNYASRSELARSANAMRDGQNGTAHTESPENAATLANAGEDNAHGSQDTPGFRVRPFLHSNNDRYRIVDVNMFRSAMCLNPVPPENENGEPPIASDAPDTRYCVPSAGTRDPFSPWCDLKWATDRRENLVEQLNEIRPREDIYVGIQPDDQRDFRLRIPATFDKRGKINRFASAALQAELENLPSSQKQKNEQESSSAATDRATLLKSVLNTKKEAHMARTRVMRSQILFLWGIGPNLCSLIHLEAVGHIYNLVFGDRGEEIAAASRANNRPVQGDTVERQKRNALNKLDIWLHTLRVVETFVYLWARAIELNLEEDDIEDWTRDNPDRGTDKTQQSEKPFFRPCPDLSTATLGLRLYKTGQKNTEKQDTNTEETFFGGIVGDVLMRLQLAQIYANELRNDIDTRFGHRHENNTSEGHS